MKILILANNDVGLYKFRKELIYRLLDEGHEVSLSLPDGDFVTILRDMGCQYYNTPIDRRGMNPVKDVGLFFQYIRIVRELEPDVVLTYTIKPNIYGGIVCRLTRTPYIENITGLGSAIENRGVMSKVLLLMYKIALKDARQVFFQNKYNKERLEKQGIVSKQGKLIPGSGVNLEEHCYEEYPSDENGIRLLFAGRILKDKGIEELLSCAECIKKKHPNTIFSLVGGFDEEEYRQRVEDLEKQNIIKYYGQQNDVHQFMKTHHAIVLPSYHEGLSNVLLEAAACGRPVLTTNVPGCMETFDEGISGLGFQPRNVEALCDAVEKFLALPNEERKQMGLNGRRKVETEFSRDIVIHAYMEIIEDLKQTGEK